jgi:glyoxylase-like metal-dependent hydrolase (beta-lactamase superfamily II)
LANRGIQPDDVTDMILTHLHYDHCGGGIYRGEDGKYYPTSPNARYWVSRQQWENALHPNIREKDAFFEENLIPMEQAGVLYLIEEDQYLIPEIELRLVHGHTPGQIIPLVFNGQQTYVFGADLIPTHLHIPIKYNMAYDLEVLKTMEEKSRMLQEIVENRYILILEHDPRFAACTVHQTIKGYRMDQQVDI